MKRLFYIVLTSLLVNMVQAQTVATLDADTIALGDQTVWTVPMQADSTGLAAALPKEVLVLGQAYDSASGTLHSTITCFEPGEYWLPAAGDSLLLVVSDVEVDTTSAEIRDIAPLVRVPYTFWEIFRWVLLALAIAAAGFGVWWVVSHRKKIGQVLGMGPQVDNRTPEERALDALEALRTKQLWQAGKVKDYYSELTDIARRFVEETTDIHATDMTSEETTAALEEAGWRAEAAQLHSVLTTADLVKFAKGEPLADEHNAALSRTENFIRRMWELLKPREEAANE